jgi:hypothetical protein
MTESADTQPAFNKPPSGVALIEIWKRPWFSKPNTFWRELRPEAPPPWEPALDQQLIHKSGAACTITGILPQADGQTLYIIEWMMGDAPMRGEFYREDMLYRFTRRPEDLPTPKWVASPWRVMNSTFAKKALRMGTYTVPEYPGVTWAAREFDGRTATPADYDRIAELKRS